MKPGGFFRKLGRILISPLFLLSVFALLVGVFVWFLGPLLAFGDSRPLGATDVRLAVLLVVALLWGVAAAFLQSRQGVKDQKLLDGLRRREEELTAVSTGEAAAADAEIAIIRRHAEQAIGRLRSGAGRQFLRAQVYRLPWYLVIGPERSGKTAMIANSGLELPFGLEQDRVTETCDFILTNDAVFLDTSGRYATAADRSVGRQVWYRLLDLIRRYRPAHPLAGIFVVVSAEDLATMSEEAVRSLATTLRRRLDDVPRRLKSYPPIYLVVSKIDRVVGFEAFFDTLGREEREQIWGFPLARVGETEALLDPASHFMTGFARIVRRISDRQTQRLQDEPDTHRRGLIFEFPNQLAALQDPLFAVVNALSLPHQFDRSPFLRGVFLASAHQSDNSLELIAGTLAPSYAQPARVFSRPDIRTHARSRSFFLKSIFRDLAFTEAAAGSMSRRAWYASNGWRAIATGAAVLVGLVVVSIWSANYRAGAAHAQDVETRSQTLISQFTDLDMPPPALVPFASVMAILDRLADLQLLGRSQSGSGLLSTAPIGEATDAPYETGLQDLLIPYLTSRLESGLQQADASTASIFQQLKLYLLIGRERDPATAKLGDLAPALTLAWLGADASAANAAALDRHLQALARSGYAAVSIDAGLVAVARQRIAEATVARLTYDLVLADPAIVTLPVWRPSDHMSAAGPLVMARNSRTSIYDGVPGIHAREPFLDIVVPTFDRVAGALAEDAWVLGPSDAVRDVADQTARFRDGALDLLRADDIRVWDGLLSDLSVVPFQDAGRAAEALARLVDPQSPASELMAATAGETNLDRPPPDPASAGAEAALAGGQQRLGALVGGPSRTYADPRGPGAPVTDHFADVRRATIAAGPDQPSQVAAVLKTFEPLYRQLNHVASGGAITELGVELQPTLALITEATERLPAPLQPFFVRLKEAATDVANGRSRDGLREIWASTVLPACRAAIQDRFPFTPGAADDTPLGDFAGLFAPTGQIASFRETYLKPYIDTSARPWRWRASSAEDLGFSPTLLQQFEHADSISQAFFPAGDGPTMQFALEVSSLSDTARSVKFDVGGPTVTYAHGPAKPLFTQWPPTPAGPPAILSMLPEVDGAQNMIVGQGPWGLFRLVSRAQSIRKGEGNAIQASFAVGPRRTMVTFTPSTTRNPFELGLLDTFRCPDFS